MKSSILHRKEALILTTIDLIHELGIQGVTTREIAKRQNVSEATIFRHYKNKNELLMAVLDYYVRFDEIMLQSIQVSDLNPLESIEYLIIKYAEYFQNYPALTAITQLYEVLRYEGELKDKVNQIMQDRMKIMTQLMIDGQKSGVIKQELDPEVITTMLFGLIREIFLHWRLGQYRFNLKVKIETSYSMFLSFIKTS